MTVTSCALSEGRGEPLAVASFSWSSYLQHPWLTQWQLTGKFPPKEVFFGLSSTREAHNFTEKWSCGLGWVWRSEAKGRPRTGVPLRAPHGRSFWLIFSENLGKTVEAAFGCLPWKAAAVFTSSAPSALAGGCLTSQCTQPIIWLSCVLVWGSQSPACVRVA